MLAYSSPTATVTPCVPTSFNPLAPATVVVPVVPYNVHCVLIVLVAKAVTRP